VDRHEPTERDWRRDDLQDAVAASMRFGADAAARGVIPDVWIGHGRGETKASLWLQRKADMTDSCRTGIVFTDTTCGLSVFRPSSCHTRACPRCEARRAGQHLDRFERAAVGCNAAACRYAPHLRPGGPGHLKPMRYPKLLTFTLPNAARGWDNEEPAVRRAQRELTRYFGRLRERAIWRGGSCKTPGWRAKHTDWLKDHGRRSCRQEPAGSRVRCDMPKHLRRRPARLSPDDLAARKRWQRDHGKCGRFVHQAVAGGVRAIETTYNERTDSWHVHMHVLVDGPFLIAAELLDTWRAVTDGTALVLDVKSVHCRRCKRWPIDCRCTDEDGSRDAYGVRGALREVLKYIGKPTDDPDRPADETHLAGAAIIDRADPLRLAELAIAWHGARLVAGFGTWSSLPGDEHQAGETTFIPHPDDPFAGWQLPRYCPFCLREANWLRGPPNVRSRLEPVPWGPRRRGEPRPLLWLEPVVV
jgi:hypothetical protein